MGDNGYITVKEASKLAKVNICTIYNNLKHLNSKLVQIGSKQIKYVRKSDVETFFNASFKSNRIEQNIAESKQIETNQISKDDIKDVIEEFFETKQAQLYKPLEENALVRYGAISKENEFLKQRLEVVIEENRVLQEKFKVLPEPVEQVEKALKEQEHRLKAEYEGQSEKEKLELESRLKTEQEEQMRLFSVEKEKQILDLESELTRTREQAEKEKAEIAIAWKKELEQAKKPWWRLWS